MIPQKEIDEVRNKLKRLLQDIGKKIIGEIKEENVWGFLVQHGGFSVALVAPKNIKIMLVQFNVRFSEDVIRSISKIREDSRRRTEFDFGFKSSIISPMTGYKLILDDNEQITGFEIIKVVHPYHESFSVKDLEEAIQAVVSVGTLGLAFLESILGQYSFEQEIADIFTKPEPDGMYF